MIVVTGREVLWFLAVFGVVLGAMLALIWADERAARREDQREDCPECKANGRHHREALSRLDRADRPDDWGGWRP